MFFLLSSLVLCHSCYSKFLTTCLSLFIPLGTTRSDSLYLTITLADVKEEKIELSESKLTFTGKAQGKDYAVTVEFLNEIETEGSVWNVLASSIQMKLNKKVKGEEFWPRLMKDKALEKNMVTIDWDRYVEEDEEEGGFDMDNMQGGQDFGGGMGGMGGQFSSY